MSTLSPKSAVNIVKSKAKNILTTTGKYEVVVSNDCTNYVNDKNQHIVNLRAMTSEMKSEAMQLLRDGKYEDAANYVKNRKDEDVLRITALSPMPVSKAVVTAASEFDEFANLLEEVEAVTAKENVLD